MDIKQYCSLESSKKLFGLGIFKDGVCWWIKINDLEYIDYNYFVTDCIAKYNLDDIEDYFPAPVLNELLNAIPMKIETKWGLSKLELIVLPELDKIGVGYFMVQNRGKIYYQSNFDFMGNLVDVLVWLYNKGYLNGT